jgi:hypothetical protein
MSHAYAREPTCSDFVPEQTHDDCEWLNEKDGEEDVTWNQRDRDRCVRSPAIGQDKYRRARREDDSGAENGSGNRRDNRRVRGTRLIALGRGAARIRLRLVDDSL